MGECADLQKPIGGLAVPLLTAARVDRAGLTVDREHEEADYARGTRIHCPVLVLWSLQGDLEDLEALYGDPRDIWQHWAHDVQGHGIDSGHHMPEETPARSPLP
ncbi:hypothetical protein [Streptomyces anulatus]|uniref:hypothetical protein n=1 Tax=Streptomyces anulatus TaxID=1892 RepID=UPI0033D2D4E3